MALAFDDEYKQGRIAELQAEATRLQEYRAKLQNEMRVVEQQLVSINGGILELQRQQPEEPVEEKDGKKDKQHKKR